MFGSLDGSEDALTDTRPAWIKALADTQVSPGTSWANRAADIGSRYVKGLMDSTAQMVQAPGATMQPNPYPPGSEEAAWYDQNRADTMAQWAPAMALNTIGTGAFARPIPVNPGEAVLGAGITKTKPEIANVRPAEVREPAVTAAGDVGGAGGDPGLLEAQAQAQRWAGQAQPLPGLPTKPIRINDQWIVPGPIGSLREVAESYMAGRPEPSYHKPPEQYHPLDPEHSKAIAQAFEEMPHAPDDPAVKASYDAMAKETRDQYRHIIEKTGLQVEPIPPGMKDPYAANPRLAAKDVAENNHLWFYPTESGFGTSPQGGIDMATHPMMQPSGEMLNGKPLLNNDLFRIVHDIFGHLKEGHGFRAAGEDNAWRSHAAMYSDLARPAMTTETRGQNSWVNFGPHGEANRIANGENTVFADQKVGLLPEWVMRDRGSPEPWIVHHGGPNGFSQFDFNKIGAGEGNQAYGYGLYFAEHGPVSEWYQNQLAPRRDPLLQNYGLTSEDGARMGIDLANSGGDAKALIKDLTDYIAENKALQANGDTSKATSNIIERSQNMIKYLQDPNRFRGYRYQVAIDRPKEHFIEWEKPFREQSPYVQEKLQPLLQEMKDRRAAALPEAISRKESQLASARTDSARARIQGELDKLKSDIDWEGMSGQRLYEMAGQPAVSASEGHPKSTARLRDMGIAGLRYLDQNSRVAGGTAKSSNVVTFDAPRMLTRFSPPTEAEQVAMAMQGLKPQAPAGGQPSAPAIVGDRSKFVDPDTGMAIPGPAYTKEAQAINRDISQGPKGAGPMDLSTQGQVPDVMQQPLERYVPPRGIPARMVDAMQNPAVRQGLEESMKAGAGVRDWYHTEPIRQEFLKTLGPEAGETAFAKYMDYVAATSPRSDVPTNIRNASYYYAGGDPATANPYPYGHVAQNLHKQNITNLQQRGTWDPLQNPKPASFAENLRGNLEPVTVDTHAFRNIGMRTGDPRFLETTFTQKVNPNTGPDSLASRYGEVDKKRGIVTFRPQQLLKEGRITMEEAQKIPAFWTSKPKETEYGAAEQMFRDAANKVGMRPADSQAAAWAGAGDMTGLGTVGTHTFPELMNERITFTAKMRGEDPHKVLTDFITGKKPLLSIGGAAAIGGGAAALAPGDEAQASTVQPQRFMSEDASFKKLSNDLADEADARFMQDTDPRTRNKVSNWASDFVRSPNVDDRRHEDAPSAYPPEGLQKEWRYRPGELEAAASVPSNLLAKQLGSDELDRMRGLSLLRDAINEKQLMNAMKKSEPASRRSSAKHHIFGSLDGR